MKKLKIYFTSDIHGFVYPTDYINNEKKPIGMLNLINSFTKDENTLIIDGGDTLQGSPFTTFLTNEEFNVHPISKVINSGKYDFVTLGNHDFNYGYENLRSYLDNINAECVCCNVKDKTGKLPIKEYSMKIMENGLKVAIIGFTTDFINVWEQPKNLENFSIDDTFSNVKRVYEEVKDLADIIIGVYHGGFEKDLDSHKALSETKENLAYKICEELGFDILLTGHQHMAIEGQKLFDTYIVQTPQNGQRYIELNLQYDEKITNIESKLVVPEINPEKDVYNELMVIEEKVQKWLDSPVGHLDVDLTPKSHIDMAMEGSLLANFINMVQLEESHSDIACTSFANSIKGFNKDVTVRDIVSTYIYPNTLVVLKVTGEILKKALNRCGEYFAYDGREVTVSDAFLKPKVEHYNYDYFSNIEYGYKLNENDTNTLEYVKFKNQEVKDDDEFTLVMNNYRASGAGGYEFYTECEVVKEIQVEMTEIIINYFNKYKNVVVDKNKYISVIK
ncbi:2',3'-cyclic-nucleotide 2'-phosphodiesterase / 3'-nucleotidase [Clostridium sp. DSM 8431]|uniref:bifunctional metallophosphatase/5'-nucleotidase n=1 Tax=Clostridium sp. DSM 8431 TaxID=1761781 RepID=UPI0008E80D40|nr:bifunctional UDP-sugar hydrolase/5'-nucleotidase [Clostridium sp. DSM 8431]SFU77223.1 2',3'-cyclic-nucleotide 2'-phosphodiesterase / 3'-nucleotidase [Clostridium sp. DSM 8431]